MCGIVGVVRRAPHPDDVRAVAAGVQALAPRGPDASAVVRAGAAVLGVARLAIRGGAAGEQPMSISGAAGASVLAWNGEVYAACDRAATLAPDESDTAWLLRALMTHGLAALDGIHAMYALAWWSPARSTLVLARDDFGQKPLYVAALPEGGVAFASEPKALRVIAGIDWSIDHYALHLLLRHGFVPGERTGWCGVRKLRPGARLTWTPDGLAWTAGRRVMPSSAMTAPDDAVEALRAALRAAVDECLPGRPVGVLLSGGIDSSAISALSGPVLPAWTIRWDERAWDESAHACEVAASRGMPHTLVDCGVADLAARFDALVAAADEPLADESLLPTAVVCEAARRQVDVVLGGDGADELFGGYARYGWEGDDAAYIDTFAASPWAALSRLLPGVEDLDDWPVRRLDEVRDAPRLHRRRWLDLHGYLPDQVLAKVDRMSMRSGLEARAPFLSPRVAGIGLGLAPSLLVGPTGGKAILRAALAGWLPAATLSRAKMGFGVPTDPWFRGPLRAWVGRRLSSGVLEAIDALSMDGVRALYREHVEGRGHFARSLFGLLCLEAWLRRERG